MRVSWVAHAVLMAAAAVGARAPFASADHTWCSDVDGTVPGSSATLIVIGQGDAEPYQSIYIDDRDGFDLDGDGEAGGLWIYAESNGSAGLTRGGEWIGHTLVGLLPEIEPIYVLPADPDRPVHPGPVTLFPEGVSPGEYPVWSDDPCVEYDADGNQIPADTLLF